MRHKAQKSLLIGEICYSPIAICKKKHKIRGASSRKMHTPCKFRHLAPFLLAIPKITSKSPQLSPQYHFAYIHNYSKLFTNLKNQRIFYFSRPCVDSFQARKQYYRIFMHNIAHIYAYKLTVVARNSFF